MAIDFTPDDSGSTTATIDFTPDEEVSAPQFTPKSELGAAAGAVSDFAQAPLISDLPDAIKKPAEALSIPGAAIGAGNLVQKIAPYSVAPGITKAGGQVMSGMGQGLQEMGESLTSPLSIATMGADKLFKVPKIIHGIVSAAFGILGAKQATEAASQLKQAIDKKDWQTAARLATEIVSGTAQTAFGAHALDTATEPTPPISAKPTTTGEPNASQVPEASQLHADVRPQPVQVQKEVPTKESRGGILDVSPQGLTDEPKTQPIPDAVQVDAGATEIAPETPTPPPPQEGQPTAPTAVNPPPPQAEVPVVDQPVKYKIGKSPQTFSLVEKLPQSEVEKSNGEQAVRVRNDKTGETSIVDEKVLTPVKDRSAEPKPPKRDLDAELKAAKLDPSVFKTKAQKIVALERQKAKFPEGPGAATASSESEFNQGVPETQQGYGGQFKYGIAERVREERAKAGQVPSIPPGTGTSPLGLVERGRELLASGQDPEARLQAFEKTNRLNSDDVAIWRAHGEALAKTARDLEDKLGRLSPEWKAADKALAEWDKRTKSPQTESSEIFRAQQGETDIDIDTGTFTGIQRAYRDATGKDFNAGQAEEADRRAKAVSDSDKDAAEASVKAIDSVDKEADKVPDSDPTKRVWKRAKVYIAQGVSDFDEIATKVATDEGIPADEVRKTLTKNQTTRRLTDEAYRKQFIARRIKGQARIWLDWQTMSKSEARLKAIPSSLFFIKTFGHGTVAMGTHAPTLAFQPLQWGLFGRNFANMYRMVGSDRFYTQEMAGLQRRDNFITAKRAGLVNDPFEYEEYASPEFMNSFRKLAPNAAKTIDWMVNAGNRGYSVLKVARQDLFDKEWDALPETAKTPEMAKAIADAANHTTGIVKSRAPKGASLAFFAPRLEASRAAWLYVDPAKSALTFANWEKATPEAKHFALHQLKEKAWVMGTLLSMLGANAAMLSATGSKQKINFTDPSRSDWMKFKVAGMDFSFGNAMLSMARFPANIYVDIKNEGKFNKLIYEDENVATTLIRYLRTQASPIASLFADLGLGRDYEQRPLPRKLFGVLPGATNLPKRLKAQGVTKPYSWTEYVTSSQVPIFTTESVKEVWRNGFGMNPKQVRAAFRAFVVAGITGGTGGRVSEDTSLPKQAGTNTYTPPPWRPIPQNNGIRP
jgi:hypothetical protein